MVSTGSTTGSPTLAPRMIDYWAITYRRTYKASLISSFVTPLLYILAMGVLLGGFIPGDPTKLEGATTYLAFVAPGMVAAQTMTTVFGHTTYMLMGMIKWNRIHDSMLATPLGVPDLIASHLGFVVFRVGLVSGVFMLVMAPFGVFESVTGTILAFFVQLLLGVAIGACVYGFTAGLKDESAFSLLFRFGLIPMFLFSGAFFPIANLSPVLERLAQATPLWHGVDLTRMLVLGRVDGSLATIHVVYLVALAAIGWWWANRRLTRRLVR
jgi:lipooligosaccharide transport system permease protein